jgi:hypothetical protein
VHGRDVIPRCAPIATPAVFDRIVRWDPVVPQFVFLEPSDEIVLGCLCGFSTCRISSLVRVKSMQLDGRVAARTSSLPR